jgi:asparagine synthase (glutamine-hydrolysing)
MFAFALWDKESAPIVSGPGRFGMKPLYWWFDGTTFLFASEIKSILMHPKVSAAENQDALN